MSGFHTATPGARPSSIALQARTAARRQTQYPGSTTAESAGEIKRAARWGKRKSKSKEIDP